MDPEESRRDEELTEPGPGDAIRIQRFKEALQTLREIDPDNQQLRRLEPPDYVPTEEDVRRIEAATEEAISARTCNQDNPTGLTAPPAQSPADPARPAALKGPEEIAAHAFMKALRAFLDGDLEEAEACRAELPPEVAGRMIPGIVGPGTSRYPAHSAPVWSAGDGRDESSLSR